MRCKSKSHYISLWVLLSPLTDNCVGLWRYENGSPVLAPSFMVRPDMIRERTGASTLDSLWSPFVSHGRTVRQKKNKKKRDRKLMLISGEEWGRGKRKIQISFMRIYWPSAPAFVHPFSFKNGKDEARFLPLNGWWVTQGRRWKMLSWNDMSLIPSLI